MLSKKRHSVVPAVYLLLVNREEDEILLMRRCNSGFYDGYLSVPAGHVEKNETPVEAVIREAKEETGVLITTGDISEPYSMYRKEKNEERIDFFFVAYTWKGKPTIQEREKCDEMKWVSLWNLPNTVIPYVAKALYETVNNRSRYGEFGWK